MTQKQNQTLSWLFVASLFGCYWTVTPAVLLFLGLMIPWSVDSYIKIKNWKSASSIAIDLEKLKTEMAQVQLKLGFSPRG